MHSNVFLKIRWTIATAFIGAICGGLASCLTLQLIIVLMSGGDRGALESGWLDLPRYAHAGILCGFASGVLSGLFRASGITTGLIAAGAGIASALLLPAYLPLVPWIQ